MDRRPISIIHLIKLIDAADAFIRHHQRPT